MKSAKEYANDLANEMFFGGVFDIHPSELQQKRADAKKRAIICVNHIKDNLPQLPKGVTNKRIYWENVIIEIEKL